MKTREVGVIATSFALLLAVGSLAAPIYADLQSGASQWVNVDAPSVNYSGNVPVVNATFVNNSTSPINATAYATIHNSLGQTVGIESVAIVGLFPGGNATLAFPVAGTSLDAYLVDIFVTSSSGVAISAEVNCTVAA